MSDINADHDIPADSPDTAAPDTAAPDTAAPDTAASATEAPSSSATDSADDTLGTRGDDADNPASKDPADWVTGDEPMTAPQKSYLDTLAREAGEEVPDDLTKAQASVEIDRLQSRTGRGQ